MLPAIVIVGEQSSGKSSMTESISGIGLPRGNGMCTKVPLELQLRKSAKESITMMYTSPDGTELNRFDLSFDEISAAIESATKALVGTEKAVKDHPITLKICSPGMKDLTLIDLPGITRASNDPEAHDVERKTSDMIRKYVEAESRVIVCALPANVDFSNSGALKIALDMDKEGKRTLGVVTKIDTYEKATQIKERLESTRADEIRLKLGYVAVRCRNQMELQNGMSLDELHAVEKKLLTTDDELKHIREDLKGTPVLINKVIEIQRTRLCEKVPELIKKVESAIVDRAKELDKLKVIP